MSTRYEIRVQGHLDTDWTAWFDGLSISHRPDGSSCLCGPVADQAALHGLLLRVRNLGLELISVVPLEPAGPAVDGDDA